MASETRDQSKKETTAQDAYLAGFHDRNQPVAKYLTENAATEEPAKTEEPVKAEKPTAKGATGPTGATGP